MRPWITTIFNNTEAHADFLTWFASLERTLFEAMQKALLDGDTQKATGCAHELKTYQAIVDKFSIEARELRQQSTRGETK